MQASRNVVSRSARVFALWFAVAGCFLFAAGGLVWSVRAKKQESKSQAAVSQAPRPQKEHRWENAPPSRGEQRLAVVTAAGQTDPQPLTQLPLATIALEPASWLTRAFSDDAGRAFRQRTISAEEFAEEGEHAGRHDWFYAQRAYPQTEIPFGAMLRAHETWEREAAALRLRTAREPELSLAAPTWTPLGPAPIAQGQTFGLPRVPVSGRINVIALHPGYNGTDNQTLYIGAATGGVWRSTNNGTTWTPLFETQPFLAVGALAIDPQNPNVIYAGTGEGKVTQGYYGVGLLKSTDGGVNWSLITGPISTRPPNQPAFINASFTKIAIDPVTPATVFATTTIGVPNSASSSPAEFPPLGQRGVWRSTDGGQNWTNVDPPGTGGNFSATDVMIDPRNSNRVFAVMRGVGIFRSESGGVAGSWTKLAGGLPAETEWLRGNFAVGPPLAPATETTIYLALAATNSNLRGIFRSTDNGATWTELTRPQTPGQANYNLALAVDPVNANTIYYGTSANSNNNGGTLWRSLNGGQSWADLSQGSGTGGLHADTHFIVISPTNRTTLFTANDGGVFRTENALNSPVPWTNLNATLNITQFQSVALHPTEPDLLIGGTQDNGTNRFNGSLSWTNIDFGDGGHSLIDQANPQVMYHTYFNVNGTNAVMGPSISFNGGNSWPAFVGCNRCAATSGNINPNDRVSFYAPLGQHTGFTGANGNVIYFGTNRLYRSADRGQVWTGVGPSNDGFGTDLTKNVANTQSYLTTIAAHPQLNQTTVPPGEVVWIGTSDGNIQRTTNAGLLGTATWTNLTKAPLPNRFVTDIALDAANQQRAVVTFSGFNANTTATPGHVFLTVNGGTTWTDISGNLPDTPANTVVIDPTRANTYYVGTDIGVFQTSDGGTTWIRMDDGMPKVPVVMLRFQSSTASLVAATHGRGIFRAVIGTAVTPGQTTEELKTDDGTAETGTSGNGLVIVNRLTPSSYPSTLRKIRIFISQFQNQPNPSGQQIRLIALNSVSAPPAGTPRLLDQLVTIPTITSAGFVEFTINNGPTIQNGDWFIGYQLPNPSNGTGFLADTNGTQQQRAFFSADGGATYQGPLVFGGTPNVPANIMIRAVVENGTLTNNPSIDVQPSALDFGNVNVNAPADRSVIVRNLGAATLNITGIASSNPRFTITSGTTFSLAAGTQQSVTVRFAPGGAGPQTGILTITSNDPLKPSVTVALSGAGISGSDLVTLTSGVAFSDSLPAPSVAGSGVINPVQYAIAVPSGATELKIELQGNQDVDMYARFGTRVAFSASNITADFIAESPTGTELIIVTPTSAPALQAGNFFIAVANFGPGAVSYTIKATVTGGGNSGQTVEVKVDDGSAESGFLLDGLSMVNRITPASYPARLDKIRVLFPSFLNQPSPVGKPITLLVLTDPTGSGQIPINAPFSTVSVNVPGTSLTEFFDFTLQGGPTINSGDFYVGFQAPNPAQGVGFGVDANGQPFNRTFVSLSNRQSFTLLPPQTGATSANAMIRAVVTTGTQPACTFTLSATGQAFNPGGGTGSVNVTTTTGCAWTASSSANWVTINSGASGAGNGTVNFTVAANGDINARTATLTIAGQSFTVTQSAVQATNRLLRVVASGGVPGSAVQVPIELVALGDEHALGFSLIFDQSVLGNPQVALGSDATGATANVNTSQIGQGRLGVTLALPNGQVFSAGPRRILVVTFTIAANASIVSTPIAFGDLPVTREISNLNAAVLPANFTAGAVSIALGFEGDVAPRPNGNGSLTVTDWVQIGRFAAGVDGNLTGSEYQRADCAPRDTGGNGLLTVTDWVQAGRYAAGLDPLTPASGPTGPPPGLQTARRQSLTDMRAGETRKLRFDTSFAPLGRQRSALVELTAVGNENALGFSVNFDWQQWRFTSATLGADAIGATLYVNRRLQGEGRLGVMLALPTGQTLTAGTRQLVLLQFEALDSDSQTPSLAFGDWPVAREVSDARALVLPTRYQSDEPEPVVPPRQSLPGLPVEGRPGRTEKPRRN